MDFHDELGGFLRTRRAQLRPDELGLVIPGERRRVPGLRRAEVAMLAGVSESYYRNLEQGVSVNASPQVLDALARVLRLDAEEHEHLLLLARQAPRFPAAGLPRPERRTPEAQRFIEMIDGAVLHIGAFGDILGWNPLAHALFAGHLDPDGPDRENDRPNLARLVVLDPHSRELLVDWPAKVRDTAGHLRRCVGVRPDDPRLTALIGELSVKSDEFTRAWAEHDVRTCTFGPFAMRHPLVGSLTVDQYILVSPLQPEQTFMAFSAEKGSPSAEALELLACIVASSQQEPPQGVAR
jgi:transcriptional regulator with XRE-family HTH domain